MLDVVAPSDLRGSQRPGLLHLRDGIDATSDDALYLLGEWGFGYDDWQNFAMAAALRERADGRWRAKEFGLEVPRQNGKGELIEGRECLGLFLLDERELIHSAHEFATARAALDRMDDRIGQNPSLKRRVKTIKRAHGDEGVYLKDGRKLLYKTRTKGGGRGFSADLLILDEAMFIAEAFLSALMPTISARPNAQMWYTGSAVDQDHMEDGVVFARIRERAIAGGEDAEDLTYLGWSPSYGRDGWDTPAGVPREATADPEVIAQANPALGIRIRLDHILRSERQAMDHRSFCVERLGVGDWPRVTGDDGAVISVKQWLGLKDPDSEIADRLVASYDVSPDRSSAAVCVAGVRDDGLAHVEVVEHKRGTGWLVDYVSALVDAQNPAAVLYDEKSQASSLAEAMRDASVPLRPVKGPDHAKACGDLVDAVNDRTVRHLGTAELVTAIRGAAQRSGEAWTWSRTSSDVDITPLVGCTLALWGSRHAIGGGDVFAFSDDDLETVTG